MSRRVTIVTLLCTLASFAAFAAQQPSTPPSVPAVKAAAAPAESPVIAKVLGETIYEKDVLDAIDRIARQQPMMGDQMKQKNSFYFKEALDTLVGLVLLKNEAKEQNITVPKAKIDEAWEALKKRFPGEDQFKQAMAAQGFTEADVRKQIEDNLMMQQVMELALTNLPAPTDKEIETFYNNNPQYFETPEQVHAAHILVKVEASASEEKKAEAKKNLESLRADIEAKKITFAEAAKRSDDKSNAEKGGDLGFFARGQMVKPFEDVAFAGQPGTVSDVVVTQFGFHIIQVIEKKPAGKKPLADARKNIQSFLERSIKQTAAQKHIDSLREKAKVEMVMSEAEWNKRNSSK
jgi:peptidyl-prolyl cis-trans isomerase C